MKRPLRVLLLFVCLALIEAQAQPVITYTNPEELLSMGSSGTYFVDHTNRLTYTDVLKIPNDQFKPIEGNAINLGFEHSRVWLKFDLRNATPEKLYVILLTQDIDYIDAYLKGKDSNYFVETGAMRPFERRLLGINSIVLDLGRQPTQMLLGVRDMNGMLLRIKVGALKPLAEEVYHETLINAFTFGALALTLVFSLFIFFSLGDSVYLLYATHVLFLSLVFLSFEGYLADFFWREMPFMNNGINTSLIRLGTLLTSIWFSVSFLTIRSIFPKVHRGFMFLGWLAVATFLVKLLGARWAEMAFNIITFITFVSFLAVGSWMYRQGFQSARFYLLGWGVFIIEILAIDLSLLGVLSFDHFFTYYGFHIGATFQVLFLNIALFDRIQSLKIAHSEARALALERSAENEQLLAAQAQLLEQKLEQPQATPTPDMQLLLKEFRHQRQKVRKIAIATMEGILLFPAGDIVRVEAMGSYAYVHFSNKQKILASRSLAEFESQLSEDPSFFRVHKSHIINLDYVTKYIRGAGGYVELNDGSSVEVSRRNKADFMKTMNLEA